MDEYSVPVIQLPFTHTGLWQDTLDRNHNTTRKDWPLIGGGAIPYLDNEGTKLLQIQVDFYKKRILI